MNETIPIAGFVSKTRCRGLRANVIGSEIRVLDAATGQFKRMDKATYFEDIDQNWRLQRVKKFDGVNGGKTFKSTNKN